MTPHDDREAARILRAAPFTVRLEALKGARLRAKREYAGRVTPSGMRMAVKYFRAVAAHRLQVLGWGPRP